MPGFSVGRIKEFETAQTVYKLFRNGRCRLDEFVDEIMRDNNLAGELGELYAIVEDVANCKTLPTTRYRKLHLSKKLSYSGYEAKSKHLRLYLFHDRNTGQIVVFGGKKGDQDEDIERLEKTIKEYTEFKKQSAK